jgi:hypothetical protein
LSELADYRNINGHCVPKIQPTPQAWVFGSLTKEVHTRLYLEEIINDSCPYSVIGCLGFRMGLLASWEERLSRLADYRKSRTLQRSYQIHQHQACYLGHYKGTLTGCTWKERDRNDSCIQSLVGLGFEWDGVTWEERLSDLSTTAKSKTLQCSYRLQRNTKLGIWVGTPRSNTGCT